MTNELDTTTARIIDATNEMIGEAIRRRNADTPTFIMPDRPADRSRNGRRIPRSARHRFIR